MFRSALLPLPILLALTACAPAADTTGAETPATVGSPDAGAPDPSEPYGSDPGQAEPSQTEPGSGPTDNAGAPRGGLEEPTVVAGPGLDESCKADMVQDVVGKMSDEAVVENARVRSGAKTVRVIPHDGMVTLDYRGDRLNLQLDESGKITSATCG